MSLCINSTCCVIPRGTTNGSMAFVVHSTNDSRDFVGHSGGWGGSAIPLLIGQVASFVDLV